MITTSPSFVGTALQAVQQSSNPIISKGAMILYGSRMGYFCRTLEYQLLLDQVIEDE